MEPEKEVKDLKYCLYARKSMEAEERQALSIESQISEMKKIIERDHISVVATKTEAHSAKNSGEREVFNKMIDEIKAGEYNAILTWHPDRLSRNAGDLGRLVDLMDNKLIADLLLYFTEDPDKVKREKIHTTYRQQIKDLISYLSTIADPIKEHEKPEYGDLHTIAINSVRGRTYEAFVVFAENDGKALADDTKEIYKKFLADDSLSVRFVIGRYLAIFYFRDKNFITSLLQDIFPKDDPNKKSIYMATWDGYLSNTLYEELFTTLGDYYIYAIDIDYKDYVQRGHPKNLDEALAVHIALAFAHLNLKIGDPIFNKFWAKKNIVQQKEFISFIGNSCLMRSQSNNEWLKENKVDKNKLFGLWDWALDNISDPEILSGFGFWINPEKEILDDSIVIEKISKTLEKADGNIDWDYGLISRLPVFAGKNGKETLQIITSYLLDSSGELNKKRKSPVMFLDEEFKTALKTIYTNGDAVLKQEVSDLISKLIEKGSGMFWGLKEVLV